MKFILTFRGQCSRFRENLEAWTIVGDRQGRSSINRSQTYPSQNSFFRGYFGMFDKVEITKPDNIGRTRHEKSNFDIITNNTTKGVHITFPIPPEVETDIPAKERNLHASYIQVEKINNFFLKLFLIDRKISRYKRFQAGYVK